MARAISPRERLFLLAAAVALLLFAGSRLYFTRFVEFGRHFGKLVDEKSAVLAAYREAVGREGALEAEAEALRTEIDAAEKALLPAALPPLAAADLQTRLKEIAGRAGLKIQSEKILAQVKRDAYLEIPVQIVASGDMRNIRDFIVAVETSPIFIAVQEDSLRAVKHRQFVSETRGYVDINEIQASMTLVGLIRN